MFIYLWSYIYGYYLAIKAVCMPEKIEILNSEIKQHTWQLEMSLLLTNSYFWFRTCSLAMLHRAMVK